MKGGRGGECEVVGQAGQGCDSVWKSQVGVSAHVKLYINFSTPEPDSEPLKQ